MLWENCFVGLFWYIINCIGPLWYYRVLVATVVLLRSLAAVITNNGLEPKTAACCGQINVLMVRLKISYQLVSLLCCQHLCSSVKISQRLINRRPGRTGSPERLLTHKIPRVPTFCRWRPILIFTPGPVFRRQQRQCQHLHNIWRHLATAHTSHTGLGLHFYEILNPRFCEFVSLVVRFTD